MSTIDPTLLLKAAKAFIAADKTSSLPDLADWMASARREFRELQNQSTVGESAEWYADQMGAAFAKTTGLALEVARPAILEAMSQSWTDKALKEIIAFHAWLHNQNGRQAAQQRRELVL